jgi:hypothetical protein
MRAAHLAWRNPTAAFVVLAHAWQPELKVGLVRALKYKRPRPCLRTSY